MGNGEEGFQDFLLLLKSMSLRLHLIWKRYSNPKSLSKKPSFCPRKETRFLKETGFLARKFF
jgi:hypothetical protein